MNLNIKDIKGPVKEDDEWRIKTNQEIDELVKHEAVSYTHLDVYKRQHTHRQTDTQTLFGKRLFFMF